MFIANEEGSTNILVCVYRRIFPKNSYAESWTCGIKKHYTYYAIFVWNKNFFGKVTKAIDFFNRVPKCNENQQETSAFVLNIAKRQEQNVQ